MILISISLVSFKQLFAIKQYSGKRLPFHPVIRLKQIRISELQVNGTCLDVCVAEKLLQPSYINVTRPDEVDRKTMPEGVRMQVAHPDHLAVFSTDPPDMDAREGENGGVHGDVYGHNVVGEHGKCPGIHGDPPLFVALRSRDIDDLVLRLYIRWLHRAELTDAHARSPQQP